MNRHLIRNERGVSTVVTHVLAIAITSLLIVSLLLATGSYLEDQRQLVAESELRTIGNRMADELSQVDRLNARGSDVTIVSEHPDKVAGRSYDAQIATGAPCDEPDVPTNECLVLSVGTMNLEEVVPLKTSTDVGLRQVKPGEFQVFSKSTPATTSSRDAGSVALPMNIGVGRNVSPQGGGTIVGLSNRPPLPVFEFKPGSPDSAMNVEFDASSARDADGNIVKYYWNFSADTPSGSWKSSVSPVYTYTYGNDPGQYNVSLAVEDDDGDIENVTRPVTIAGLEYNNDMSPAVNNGLTFTMTNSWSSYPVEIDSILIDPKNDIDSFNTAGSLDVGGSQVADLGNEPIANGGRVVRNVGVTVNPGDPPVTVQFEGLQNDPQGEPVEIAVRHTVDGQTNTTLFTAVPGGFEITDYRLDVSGQDVDVVFNASEQLDAAEVNLQGEADDNYGASSGDDDDLSGIGASGDFSETEYPSEGVWEYRADVSDGEDGFFSAQLTFAEDGLGRETSDANTPATSDSVSVGTTTGYRWATGVHWDAVASEGGVVHEDYGDHDRGTVELGYPVSDASGLLTHYSFDEDSGNTALDATSNDHDAKHFDGPALGTDGVFEDAYTLDGSTANSGDTADGVKDTDAWIYLNGKTAVTVSAWVRSDDGDVNNRGVLIAERQGDSGLPEEGTGDDKGIGFRNDIDGASDGCDDCLKAGVSVDTGSDTKQVQHETEDNTQTTAWRHVVVTWQSGGEVEMYLDGQKDSGYADSGESGPISEVKGLFVGFGAKYDHDDGTDLNDGWHGKVDELRIYDRALSESAVENLYDTATEGSMTTDWRTGSTYDYNDLELDYEAAIDGDNEVRIRVQTDEDGDGNVDRTSAPIKLDDGTNADSVNGLGGPVGSADKYRLDIEIERDSVKDPSPEIYELELVED